MGEYDKVVDALNEHGISWADVDRIHLNEDAYDEFLERSSFEPATYRTNDNPAVRCVSDEEKVVYVDSKGYIQEIEL